jgi:hypothetical protein
MQGFFLVDTLQVFDVRPDLAYKEYRFESRSCKKSGND